MQERRSPRKIRVLPIIRSVRLRWRLRMAFRGLSIVLGAGFLAFLLSAYGLEAARFTPVAVTMLRALAWILVAALSFVFLVRPLFRRIKDDQVALYLEEHEPSLEAAILGAMDAERSDGEGSQALSPALLERLVERAVDRARAVDYGRRIDRKGLYQGSAALAVIFLAVLLFTFFGPRGLRYGLRALALPTTEAAEVSPYSITVLPGDVTVARGSDLLISAKLEGFDSDDVSVFSRMAEDEPFQRLSMLPADSGHYELLLLNVVEDTRYLVEANGVRSASHLIEVADLPYVDDMTHRYVFPDYTGLDPREVSGGGDIAALEGTRVEMSIRSTLATPAGQILVNDSVATGLVSAGDGALFGEIVVGGDGVYRIELARSDGQMVDASPEYTIDVLEDLPPSVTISDPGRDSQASPIEEVFIEAQADDDYGIGALNLVYSVNGGAEDTLSLFAAGGAPLQEVTSGHTLFLEEWDLEPGDVVSYYALARDNRPGLGVEAFSDIYFINVRPFRRDFRQADQQQGGGLPQGGGNQGAGVGENGSLSELQREVVAATFNLLRDREHYTTEEFSENTVSVALAQGRVRDEVASLLVQMNTRGVAESDPHFREIADLLPAAIEDMEAAEALLRGERTRDALPPEQRALRFLQKAEETYERVVQQQQSGGGGGGGGGGGASAEELADLFELELDKLQNQYETVQRGERQQADAEVDGLMERLKELARRQQQELERQRRQTDARQGGSGSSGGDSQRALADEAEETARQLEELSRRTGDRDLAESARRLREAAETMRRSASRSGQSQGMADATSALDDLQEAQRRLERNQETRMQDGIQDALERVDRLAESQDRVREEVEQLPEDPQGRRQGIQEIHDRKDEMVQETQALERDLYRMQQTARRESREVAGELEEAVETIRQGKLKEKLAYTKGVVEQRDREFALEWEDQISSDIEDLRETVEGALRAYTEEMPDRDMERALEEARELARGAESLGRRLENRGTSPPSDQGGQGEEPGGEGRPGQEGQSGQVGQAGQESQPGQGAQPGQQAGQGRQSGQGQQEGRAGERTGAQGGQGGGQQENQGEDTGASTQRVEGSAFGGATRGNPVPFTEEEVRQFTREFAQRLAQARELRETLREGDRETPELDEAIEALEDLRDPRLYGDLPQIQLLQEQIRESLKRLEFLLRREVEGEDEGRAALSGTDDVPAGFRKMVEEYFRNLARSGGGSGGSGGDGI